MNMKSDDLERLEESQEMQQLIRSAKAVSYTHLTLPTIA